MSADLAHGQCLSQTSEPLSDPPHKQSTRPGLMFLIGSVCRARSSDYTAQTETNSKEFKGCACVLGPA